jgi:hypothetical protein
MNPYIVKRRWLDPRKNSHTSPEKEKKEKKKYKKGKSKNNIK